MDSSLNISLAENISNVLFNIKPYFCFLTSFFIPDKSLKETLDKVLLSGYFDRPQSHQNGACEEEETQEEQTAVAETAVAGEQPSESGNLQHMSRYVCSK